MTDMSASFLIARLVFAAHGLDWVHGWLDGLR